MDSSLGSLLCPALAPAARDGCDLHNSQRFLAAASVLLGPGGTTGPAMKQSGHVPQRRAWIAGAIPGSRISSPCPNSGCTSPFRGSCQLADRERSRVVAGHAGEETSSRSVVTALLIA